MGALGALARYSISLLMDSVLSILLVNTVGCFLIAIVFDLLSKKLSMNIVSAIGTGFISSFTTFSAFSVECVNMLLENEFLKLFIYITISIILCIGGAFLGKKVANI